MNTVTEWIASANEQASRFVWGPVMLFCFLVIGLWFTAGTRFFQVTQFSRWMRCTILACFRDRSVTKTSDSHSISQFQSLCAVLAATTGTGNIAGIAGTLAVIVSHIHALPAVLGTIFKEAFHLQAGLGGTAGYGIMTAMRTGISRGVFTNEAGLGSSVIIHAASDVKEPAIQGMWGIFEVFIDTIIVCTLTALAILTSGVYDQNLYASALNTVAFDLLPNGAALTGEAFATVFGSFGSGFVSISVTLFAFSTLIGWSYYGEKAAAYLFGENVSTSYQIIFSAVATLGCLTGLQLVWDLSDTFNGLMAIPNLAALCLLNRQVFEITKDYLKNNP